MAKQRHSKSRQIQPTPVASGNGVAPKSMSRRQFLGNSAAGLGGALLATTPLGAYAQDLEPFIPAPNSLSNGRSGGINTGKPEKDFIEEMRDYVIAISRWAKSYRSDFAVIAMNGLELTEFLEKTLLTHAALPNRQETISAHLTPFSSKHLSMVSKTMANRPTPKRPNIFLAILNALNLKACNTLPSITPKTGLI